MSDRKTSELAEFLSARRAQLTPADAGLEEPGTRRRVPGLRREELARLAGVSVDYYTRLEQGRSRSASAEVLDALATALQLNDAERAHLHHLAKPQPAQRKRRSRPQRVDSATLHLLDLLDQVFSPAFVLGRRLDVLAHNRLAGALITEFRELPAPLRNQARFVFFDPHARELYANWDEVAADTVAMLRLDAGRYPDDDKLSALVGDLSIRSEEFRSWWSNHTVKQRTVGTKAYHHPVVGDLTVTYQALNPSGDPDQTLFIYTTEPGSPDETALRLLANWHEGGEAGTPTGPQSSPVSAGSSPPSAWSG
ncbi:helix-turn-helix transcriptional regulator [Mycolicibacterium goodii]|uniref:helix-turn-helix transcriptional regulator n=1 Tax=Mycolicibacterium goodii TaxID=134601 RepID=UPI00093C94CA|nr:helix-turn-helix transcriptional regulator [Mycolicibacterium goodii]OKH70169.1 XRE family transcriptional regulator [Mycobacterium sp. SWH-M5]ULN48310.1 helix-turn-helix transcriptional regulator [Mycolicibacterium goodii]